MKKEQELDQSKWAARVHLGWEIAEYFRAQIGWDAELEERLQAIDIPESITWQSTAESVLLSTKPQWVEVSKELLYERAELISQLKVLLSKLERSIEHGAVPYTSETELLRSWPKDLIIEAYKLGCMLSDKAILRRLAGYGRMKTGGRKARHDLSAIGAHYRQLEPELGDAKVRITERFKTWQKEGKDWKKIVRQDYTTLAFIDADLLQRLSPSPNLPTQIWNLMEKKDHDASKLSHIALEAAARRCGCDPYQYSIRWLFKKAGLNGVV